MSNKSQKIIKGYKGVMDLDLTDVEPYKHIGMIEQHHKDINDYKLEQSKLKPNLRYENSVGLAFKKLEYANKMKYLRLNKTDEKTQDILDLEKEIY
tara:strand:- start:648 stop:935 length:288 start_codon:yes stop_codon:yes gene_type:complete